ncbi:MAG: Dabb family protein [Clostridia bacterium]|nr:Dabb family protein [Clostridia bacterium]MDE6869641.1 Dabb family protein [Clostridia bacterium]MDE7209797.1 Dabb family protein [Clostridia bacterium]
MVKHIVMYKLKEPTEQNAIALQQKFLSMKGKIEVLRDIQSGVDVLRSDRSFDVVLICQFDSMEDMEIYRTHEVHLPIMAYVKSVVECSKSVDYVC